MCKIMMMAGIKADKVDKAWKLVRAALKPMSERDDDGVGYAVAVDGRISGERWLSPKAAFKVRNRVSPDDAALSATLGDAVDVSESYNSFGNPADAARAQAIIFHTRMATCATGIENTHPFVQGETALIHNGVISNASTLTNVTSTCDSECILNEYIARDVAGNPSAMDAVADAMQGYYACAVLTNVEHAQVLDIFKDDRAHLVVGRVKELDCFVFCTTEAILRDACKRAKMTLLNCHAVKAGYLIRLDAKTGASVGVTEFDYEASSYRPMSYATAGISVGSSADDVRGYDEDSHAAFLAEMEARRGPGYLKTG